MSSSTVFRDETEFGFEKRDQHFETFDDVVGVGDCQLLGCVVRFVFSWKEMFILKFIIFVLFVKLFPCL